MIAIIRGHLVELLDLDGNATAYCGERWSNAVHDAVIEFRPILLASNTCALCRAAWHAWPDGPLADVKA